MLITVFLISAGSLFVWFFPALFASLAQYAFRVPKTERKIIALTFDDGPNPPYTEKLLRVLAAHNVCATFFVVGKNMEKFPDTGKAIMRGGHIIGNHSYSHQFIQYIKSLSFESEILKTQKTIERCVGKVPALYRSPWLFQHPWLLRTVRKQHLTFVSGLFGSQREIRGRSGEKIAQDALKKARPGMILIFHDGYDAQGADRTETVSAIDLVIPELKKRGYEFVTADVLLGVPAYNAV